MLLAQRWLLAVLRDETFFTTAPYAAGQTISVLTNWPSRLPWER